MHFRERAVYYLSRAISRQGERGAEWQFDVKAVYGVFFMNFGFSDSETALRTDVVLANRSTGELFSDKMRFIFISLPAFTKLENECESDFERWIYVLKNMEALNRMPFKARKQVFEKLEQIVDIAALSKEERDRYDESIKVYRDNLAVMEYQRIEGFEKGREEGRVEGREEGREEGRVEGRAEGMLEEKKRTALAMINNNLSVEVISSVTGLSADDIAELRAAQTHQSAIR